MYSNLPVLTIDVPEEDYLYTDTSQIENAGMGLFTAIRIYKNEIIAVFDGEIIDEQTRLIRINKKENAYFIVLINGKVLDSMHSNCFAKFANDANGTTKSAFKNNSFISLDEHDRPCIVATRTIKIGEEIFCSYGENYWA